MDATAQVSSAVWLRSFGLSKKKLTMPKMLARLGFQQKEDYVSKLGRPVSSRYSHGLFQQYISDGKIYNLTAKKEEVLQKVESVANIIELYHRRLEWLNSSSRSVFGVVQEQSVVIILDLSALTKSQRNLCQDAICLVIREQVAHISKFNLVWVSQEPWKWHPRVIRVNQHSIEEAVEWILNLQDPPVANVDSTAEAVSEALDDQVEAIYYFTAGDVPVAKIQKLKQRIENSPCPLHVVCYNPLKTTNVPMLSELSHQTSGRFHVYLEKNKDTKTNQPNGYPDVPGASKNLPELELRKDELMIRSELSKAQENLKQLQDIWQTFYNSEDEKNNSNKVEETSEDCVSSKEWLKTFGLKAQKLLYYDALADCAFRHSDGIADIKCKPEDESIQTDAENNLKVINAKYCDGFVHVPWKDGSVAHVHISKEKCRWYEERMKTVLDKMNRRYQSVQLRSEQLKHKRMFNFVKFDSKVEAWKPKLAEVNEENMKEAWCWIKELQVGSSTNTLKAIQVAITDSNTQAVYLLTDGRPDQPTDAILDQVNILNQIPIHTISFNCNDNEANSFLYELSNKTGGRFHTYSSYVKDPDAPQSFVSEDIQLLLNEIEKGKSTLEKIKKLHMECLMLDWCHSEDTDVPQSSLDISSSRWLKIYGLVPRRLTIMDALAPTMVPHSAKYVPILDKHVVSKVFDEVLPLAHVSGNRKLITLINPQAVNLSDYKEKLGRAIKSYERRLNLIVWRVLPQEERDNFNSDVPISYLDNKEALLQALDRLGWPISPEDVMLLEDEIQAGKTYLQQALDLQEGSNKKSVTEYSSVQTNHEKNETQKMKQKPKRALLDTLRGQKVIARSEIDGFYYPGTVLKSINSKSALVDFWLGENQVVPIRFIIQTGGALPCPTLKVGDCALSKTGARGGGGSYVPAVVIATPRMDASDKLYTVLKYDKRKEHCLRRELIKISPSQFAVSCGYIRKAQMIDFTISLAERNLLSENIINKLEELSSQVTQYQNEQNEKQKAIQVYINELKEQNSQQHTSGLQVEEKTIAKQNINLLEQLKLLIPIRNSEKEKDESPVLNNDQPLLPGQKVLSLCSHNGLYEEGCIIHDCGDLSYFVERASGEIARIHRDDLLTDSDDYKKEIKESDPVIGPHPLHPGSYCPGVVLNCSPDLKVTVQYYDNAEDLAPREHIYSISPEKYKRDTSYILACERRWIGEPVVARNDDTATFHLAKVKKQTDDCKKYVISWADGTTAIQDKEWIFGKFSQPHVLNVGDRVLTLAHPSSLTFLPGIITAINGTKLQILFCNGKRCQNIEAHHCFGLSEKIYDSAVKFYCEDNRTIDSDEDHISSENEDSHSDISSFTISSVDSEK
ncbi:hypothetical protein GDO78_000694 [Eleutherodactylus coqui]|uniref:von Willebrand factor A domain-containing protein 3B n=1 Tax=Eleutherodactylus coqui TaxID=57060 RepID=A0A8J6FT44_ELECQ|nr:hypothetical protein GDO78_000694 [Eleutherodactylus coqui]